MPKFYESMKGFGSVGLFTWILVLLLLIYLGYRAKTLSFTHDEAYTYTRYVHHTYFEIVSYQTGNILPNNHLLNTVAQKYFSEKFGVSEFVLRLATLLSAVIFLTCAFLIARYSKPAGVLAAFVVLTLHPYLLDFMMLSRGYGIAMAFMVLSLYLMQCCISKDFDPWYGLAAIVTGSITVLANFSWLNYFIILSIVNVAMVVLWSKKKRSLKVIMSVGATLLVSAVLTKAIYLPLTIILERNLLFGGKEGFWKDTVITMCGRLAYGASYQSLWSLLFQVLIAAVVFVSIAWLGYVLYRKMRDTFSLIFILYSLTLFGMVSVTIFQFHFMDSYYPQERTALMFLPVFLLLLVSLTNSLTERIDKAAKWSKYVFSGLAVIFVSHMINSLNFSYVLDWKYDSNSEEIVHDVEKIPGDILLGVHPFFQPSFEFYRRKDNLKKFGELHVDGYRKQREYNVFVIPVEDKQKIADERLIIINEYTPSSVILARSQALK